MFLRNFYNVYARYIMGASNRQLDLVDRENNYKVLLTTGTTWEPNESSQYAVLPSIGNLAPSSSFSLEQIMFGSNDTPVTFDDYQFTPISKLGVTTTKTSEVIYNEGKWHRQLEYTITNNNDADVEINEVCMVSSAYGQTNTTHRLDYSFIFYRDVLDESIVIGSGETVKFIYQVAFGF